MVTAGGKYSNLHRWGFDAQGIPWAIRIKEIADEANTVSLEILYRDPKYRELRAHFARIRRERIRRYTSWSVRRKRRSCPHCLQPCCVNHRKLRRDYINFFGIKGVKLRECVLPKGYYEALIGSSVKTSKTKY